MTTIAPRRTVDLSRPTRHRDIGLSAGQVRHRAGRYPLIPLIPVRPDTVGLRRHALANRSAPRPRSQAWRVLPLTLALVVAFPAVLVLAAGLWALTAAGGVARWVWAWEQRHHERIVAEAAFGWQVVVPGLVAGYLMFAGVRSV